MKDLNKYLNKYIDDINNVSLKDYMSSYIFSKYLIRTQY